MANTERRRQPRTSLLVECRLEGFSQRTAARLSDVSLSGCFIEVISPMPVGSTLTVYAKLGGREVALTGRVARVQHELGRGFALEFERLSDDAKSAVAALVQPPTTPS